MISYLKGEIIDLQFNNLIILTSSGIGYEVYINELIYAKILDIKDEIVSLYIYHNISENSQNLFGFIDLEDKKIFKELIKISGIGAKVAMQILSIGKYRLVQAIKEEDNKTIEGIKGIGKKMSEKIILELKDKDFNLSFKQDNKSLNNITSDNISYENIKSTLVNMGYNLSQVEKILANLPENIKSAGEIIPYVVKNI